MIGLNGDTALQAEREATYPPPYPEAWYVVARAADVSDQPTQVRLAGHDVVLFRDGEEPAPEHVEYGEVLARVCAPRAPEAEPPAFSDTLIESLIRLVEARIGAASEASDVTDAETSEAESDRTTV